MARRFVYESSLVRRRARDSVIAAEAGVSHVTLKENSCPMEWMVEPDGIEPTTSSLQS